MRKRKKGSIEMNLSRSCQTRRKRSFSKGKNTQRWMQQARKKHIKMDATSKLLNQRSNQHVKLSKHLSTYMQSIHRSKTHTHTHKISLTNFMFQKQVRQISEHISTYVFLVMAKLHCTCTCIKSSKEFLRENMARVHKCLIL